MTSPIPRRTLFAAGGSSLLLAACSSGTETTGGPSGATGGTGTATSKKGGAGGKVGVFTWWADGSEKAGLNKLVALFKKKYPNDTFQNLAVAGGAGSNAKAKLAADLKNDNPPGSFQGHAGAELTDYISKGQIIPVNDVINALGGEKVFPKDLIDLITVKGRIYSVPSNIHRANVVWTNVAALKKAGISKPPKDIKGWIADLKKVKASGVSTPLAIGGTWTQVQLLETVLIADLGAEKYTGLFDGKTSWDSADVKKAVADFATLMTFANTASDGDDWPPATNRVISGKGAYNVMGDWAVAEFDAKKKKLGTDWDWFPVPGTDGVFDFLADSFTLPKGTKNPGASKDWLMLVGGAEGQKAFNLAKGSIPARTDVPADDFPKYQTAAIASFKKDTIVPSIAHGAAVSLAWGTDIGTAVSKFRRSKDQGTLIKDLGAAAKKYSA